MIIAILEDHKGFRKSMALADFYPYLYIPIMDKNIWMEVYTDAMKEISFRKLTFDFKQWLEKNKVALYKERYE